MRMTRRLFVAAAVVLACTCAFAQPATLIVVVDGVGAVRGDVAQGRDEAIRDALRRAVEQAVGIGIQGRTLMVDLQVVEDRVVGQAVGFVRTYRILRDGADRDADLYRVTIEAAVDTELLIGDLEGFGAMLRLTLGNPRVLIVGDATDGGHAASATVVRVLTDRLVERQFVVLDQTQLAALRGTRDARTLTAVEIAALARTVDADLVVTVQVDHETVATQELSRGTLYSVRAGVTLRAVLAGTAQTLAGSSASHTRASTSERLAREEAAEGALEDAFEPFLLSTVRTLNTTASDVGTALSIQVVIHGVAGLQSLLALRDTLAQTRGVASVQQRRFEGGTAHFDLQGAATTEDVVVRLASEIGDDRLRLDFLDAQRLEITLVGGP
jgi:hypothetical protein